MDYTWKYQVSEEDGIGCVKKRRGVEEGVRYEVKEGDGEGGQRGKLVIPFLDDDTMRLNGATSLY